jgi:hypothetical protein
MGTLILVPGITGISGWTLTPAYRAAPDAETGAATAYRLAWAGDPGEGIGGWRVAIADDAVNAGTAVGACAGQLRDYGAIPVAVAALLSVGPATRPAALSLPFYAVDEMQSQAWLPAECRLCADGVPLTDREWWS